MRFSLVMTVLNEERSIRKLLMAIDRQIRQPDEIIFVDGGSTDKTFLLLKQWSYSKNNVRVFLKRGFNISQGRNFGIRKSKGSIIVHTDAGCDPQRNWFEKIIEPFKKREVDLVAGFYRMSTESSFQKCLAPYLGILPPKLDQRKFLPSARSIAFRKKLWRRIRGFSERLSSGGEDTFFCFKAKRIGAKFFFQKNAIVEWEIPRNIFQAVKKFYNYAFSDAQINLWWHPEQRFSTHNLKVLSIYIRYSLGFFLVLWTIEHLFFWWFPITIFSLYLIWSIRKNFFLTNTTMAILWLPLIQLVSDWAIMFGFLRGYIFGRKIL